MENIILGLLLLKARTIYELRKRINEGLNLMYSCSTGSIQAAIKRLLDDGCISARELEESGRQKKLYIINEKGKQRFEAWVNRPIESGAAKNPELAKLYFMGFSEKDARPLLVENHIEDLKRQLLELELICEDGENLLEEAPDNDILFYQLQTAKYGRDLMRFNVEWFSRLLNSIEE